MALIAPVAFAAAGGLLTGGATWGMAAGWLIGSWLFNKNEDPKNQVFDPGAEEMPSFNQALRGATMPVLFGTNRVSSNIVWTNNFTTIRNETKASGGGGKGGGSGMGSKGGQPSSGEVTYEYKWDVMFHMGMSDQNLQLTGAWVGTEKVDSSTVIAIISNSDSGFATFTGVTGGEGIGLNFEDSYFHGAGATGDTIDNWTHFQTVTGGGYRFPYTVYVGFKQLELGNTARIPQISWEVGEGGVNLESNGVSTYPRLLNRTGNIVDQNGGFIKARDGTLFCKPGYYGRNNNGYPSGDEMIFARVSDGTEFTISTFLGGFGAYDTALTDFLGVNYSTDLEQASSICIIEDRYFLFGRASRGNGALDWRTDFLLIEIVSSAGDLEVVGAFSMPAARGVLFYPFASKCKCLGILGAGTDDDCILMQGFPQPSGSNNQYPVLFTIPSINALKNGTWNFDDGAGTEWFSDGGGVRFAKIYSQTTDIDQKFIGDQYGTYAQGISKRSYGWTMSKATIGILGVTYRNDVWYYIPGADVQWHLDNPGSGSSFVETLGATHPNGFFFRLTGYDIDEDSGYFGLGSPDDYDVYGTGQTKIVDTGGAGTFPWSDIGQDEAGTPSDSNDYNTNVQIQRLTSGLGAGGHLLVFWKNAISQADADLTAAGQYSKVRICLYNPISDKITEYASGYGSICESLDDWDYDTGSTTLYDPGDQIGVDYDHNMPCGYYDTTTGKLYGSIGNSVFGQNVYHTGQFGSLTISGGTDIPPPTIIYRILTSSVYGLGISENDIDSISYGLANQYCQSEGILVSTQYRREESALAIITQLLELYGGYLIDSGGKIKFGLQEFSSSPVRTIDNDHLRIDQEGEPPVLVTKGARQDTYNRVKVNYFDRNLSYRQNFIEVADEVDMDVNGVRAQEFPAKFVMSEATARKMAVRALWGNMYARDIYDFKLGAKDADLEPGDVVTLVDSYHSELQSGKQARIVTWQEIEPLTFQVKAVEEVEYISTSTLAADSVTEATSNSLFKRPEPMATFGMYELPAEFQGADAQLFVGYRQQSEIMGARLYLSADGTTYALADEVQPYIVSGIMAQGLPARESGYVEENIEVYLMPDQLSSGSFNPSSPLYAQNYALDDVQGPARALGTGNIWINSEMMAYEGVNLIAQNHYRFDKVHRGWGGTHIQGHSSGDTWWKQGGGVFVDPINIDKVGTLLYYKVTGYNFAGQEYNVSSVNARTYQILGTYWRPQVQAPIATYVQSPGSYVTIQSEDLGFIQKKQVVSGGSPVQFEWPQAAQEAGYGAQGYGVGGYGRFTQDTTSVNYRVEVLSSNLSTVVRCTTVDTTAFLYTTALNSEDWNGWQGSFAVRVTPFNPVGTALRSRTKILELFE